MNRLPDPLRRGLLQVGHSLDDLLEVMRHPHAAGEPFPSPWIVGLCQELGQGQFLKGLAQYYHILCWLLVGSPLLYRK